MEMTKLIMSCVISLVVLSAALLVILSVKYDEGSKKWAYGAVGAIMGYWLSDAL
jgi:hypothetical protein